MEKTLRANAFKTCRKINNSCSSQQQNVPKRKNTASSKLRSKLPKSFDFHFHISISSMITGVALSAAGFYYLENRNLNEDLIKSQLLLGEIDETANFSKLASDEKLFLNAVKHKNERLCLFLLRNGAKPRILSDFGSNLLVKLIENDLIEVLNFLLNSPNDLKLAIDFMDESTGKTPLLAAVQAKKYTTAKKLMEMGAKPIITSTSKYPARSINDFLKEILNVETDESEDLLKYLDKLFKNNITK